MSDGEIRVLGAAVPANADAATADLVLEEIAERVAAMPKSCVLDVIDQDPDGVTLEEAGEGFNVTRERVRQIETKAKRELRRGARRLL